MGKVSLVPTSGLERLGNVRKIKISKNNKEISKTKFELEEELNNWINFHIQQNTFGLPERPEFALNEQTGEMEPTGNILPAEYEIVIENLEENPQWLLEQAIQKRRLEYPSAEEFLNAFFDGGDEALEALKNKRLQIKSKYPKP